MPDDAQGAAKPTPEPGSPPDLGYGRRDPAAGLNATEAAITTRRSVRAFLPDKPVPRDLVTRILDVAARAPSGTNIQPWHVVVVAGAAKRRVTAAVHAARAAGGEPEMGYHYYPVQWFEPYLGRRRKLGWDMYGLLGIEKGERDKTWVQHGRNFDFFDAPVGLFFHMDRRFELGSFLDMGLFLQNVMVAARSHGLDTCPQAAWVDYTDTVRRVLGIPADHYLICGMCLGYEDTRAPVNRLYSEREPAAAFATFLGFEGAG
jgi:nitroreductase